VHWQNPAAQLHRQVRAFDPFPGALARVRDEAVKLWSARVEAGAAPAAPGTVLESGPDGVRVACGEGVLRLLELQRPGGRRLPAGAFLQGFALPSGTVFADGP
ncbi:MAG: methionyl-tRNA formyltransferase, partial [Betaproteobacteria bacterium]